MGSLPPTYPIPRSSGVLCPVPIRSLSQASLTSLYGRHVDSYCTRAHLLLHQSPLPQKSAQTDRWLPGRVVKLYLASWRNKHASAPSVTVLSKDWCSSSCLHWYLAPVVTRVPLTLLVKEQLYHWHNCSFTRARNKLSVSRHWNLLCC